MQLSTIRQKFCELSGRHDLVTDYAGADYSDNGADWYLDNGQKYLDKKFTHIKRNAWYKKDIAVGDSTLEFRYCDVIKEVWVEGSGIDRHQLEKKDLNWMRSNYAEPHANMTGGEPAYYTPLVLNLGPDQIALTSANYTAQFTYDADEIMFTNEGDHILYSGIMWMPPADVIYTVSVLGKFWAPPLYPSKGDTLETFWTAHHSDTLILAAMRSLEGFYRNREGQRDYEVQILESLDDEDKIAAEEEAQDASSMKG